MEFIVSRKANFVTGPLGQYLKILEYIDSLILLFDKQTTSKLISFEINLVFEYLLPFYFYINFNLYISSSISIIK